MDRAAQSTAKASGETTTTDGLLDDGKAGEEVVPVVPAEPSPGVPSEPERVIVDASGAQMAGVPGDTLGEAGLEEAGTAEDPVPGVPSEPERVIVDASGAEMVGVPGDALGEAGLEDPGTMEDPERGIPEEPVPGVPEEPEPAVPDAPHPEGLQDTGRTLGLPEAPEPGIPEEPTPAPPGSPGGAERDGEKNEVTGPHITLSGRVNMDVSLEAKIRIDIFDGDHRNLNAPRPKVVQFHELQRAGSFEISVPQDAKRVWIGAYADLNGNNRPDRGEPRGWYSRNPVFLMDVTETILIELVQEKVADDLGADFGG